MNYQSIISGKIENLTSPSVSEKLLQQMNRIRNGEPCAQDRRWLWELIQNAKDSAFPGHPISIRLELYANRFTLSHNGRPFGVENLISLITQTHHKSPDAPLTEFHYGTGFLSTHFLSETVNLTSILQDFDPESGARLPLKSFSLDLDRSGKTVKEVTQALEYGHIFLQNLDQLPTVANDLEDFNTHFTYPLNTEYAKSLAKNSIKDLDRIIGYVFAFVPNLSEIHFFDHTTSLKKDWKRGPEESWNETFLSLFTYVVSENGITRQPKLLLARQDKLTLALPFQVELAKFLPISPEVPRLFSNCPLFTPENTPLPVICNHPHFKTDDLRTTLPLNSFSLSQDSLDNKKILSDAMALYNEIIQISLLGSASDYFHAISFLPMPKQSKMDEKWINDEIFQRMHNILTQLPLIKIEGSASTLKEGFFFPYSEHKEELERLWHILEKTSHGKLPLLEEALYWCEALSSYEPLRDKHFISLEKLVENASSFSLDNQFTSIKFYQMIYDIVTENSILCQRLNQGEFALFPDQTPDAKLHTIQDIYVAPALEESVKNALMTINTLQVLDTTPLPKSVQTHNTNPIPKELEAGLRLFGVEDDVEEEIQEEIPQIPTEEEAPPITSLLLHNTFLVKDSTPLKNVPMDNYFKFIEKKFDTSTPQPTSPEGIKRLEMQRTEILGLLVLCHPDPFWLPIYQKFLNPTFVGTHSPSPWIEDKYLETGILYLVTSVAKLMENCESLEKFHSTYFPKEDLLHARNYFRDFLEKGCKLTEKIYDFQIFPNQYGEFQWADSLCNDLNIDGKLKEIAKLLENEKVPDYFALLFPEDFAPLTLSGIKQKTNENVALDISRGVLQVLNENKLAEATPDTQEACLQLLAWLDDHPDTGKELFPSFLTEVQQMQLLTPNSARLINKKIQQYENIMAVYQLFSAEDLSAFLERLHGKPEKDSTPDYIYQDDDLYIDFHEFPELYHLGESARKNYKEKMQKTGELLAIKHLLEKWKNQGFEQVRTDEPSRISLRKDEDSVELVIEDVENYRETGWNISETLQNLPPVYYQVKSTVSKSRQDSIELSHTQADLAFTLEKNYCIFRYVLDVHLSAVISFSEITNVVERLKAKELFFAGNKPSLWVNAVALPPEEKEPTDSENTPDSPENTTPDSVETTSDQQSDSLLDETNPEEN